MRRFSIRLALAAMACGLFAACGSRSAPTGSEGTGTVRPGPDGGSAEDGAASRPAEPADAAAPIEADPLDAGTDNARDGGSPRDGGGSPSDGAARDGGHEEEGHPDGGFAGTGDGGPDVPHRLSLRALYLVPADASERGQYAPNITSAL